MNFGQFVVHLGHVLGILSGDNITRTSSVATYHPTTPVHRLRTSVKYPSSPVTSFPFTDFFSRSQFSTKFLSSLFPPGYTDISDKTISQDFDQVSYSTRIIEDETGSTTLGPRDVSTQRFGYTTRTGCRTTGYRTRGYRSTGYQSSPAPTSTSFVTSTGSTSPEIPTTENPYKRINIFYATNIYLIGNNIFQQHLVNEAYKPQAV